MSGKGKRELIWSEDAIQTIKQIFDWNKENYSEERAQKILKSLKETARQIPENPFAYARCYEGGEVGGSIHKVLIGKTFWMIFEIETDRVIILDVIHGARNPELFKALSSKIKLKKKK